MVVPRGVAQLIPICVNRIPDAPLGAEVHRGSVYRENPSRGETPGRDLQKATAIQCDPMVEDAPGIVSGEIEEAVVREVDQGFPVTYTFVADDARSPERVTPKSVCSISMGEVPFLFDHVQREAATHDVRNGAPFDGL